MTGIGKPSMCVSQVHSLEALGNLWTTLVYGIVGSLLTLLHLLPCPSLALPFIHFTLTTASSYGDSTYGQWVVDEYSNPAFFYTGGGSPSPNAIYPTTQNVLLHNAGNDRISALLFSDGSLTLRQDEGGAKLLNGYNASPSTLQFRGGVGYLSTPTQALACSAVAGSVGLHPALPMNLTLGMGYATKHAPLFNHTVLAPFGDGAGVLSLVSLTPFTTTASSSTSSTSSTSSKFPSLAWTEVWASGDRWELGWGADPPYGSANATSWQAPWSHAFSLVSTPEGLAVGLVDGATCGGSVNSSPSPSPHDPDPRPFFLVCLSCMLPSPAFQLQSYTTRGGQLYCVGGEAVGCKITPSNPTPPTVESPLQPGVGRLTAGLDNSTAGDGQASVLALQVVGFQQAAGAATSPPLAFLSGYLTVEQTEECTGAGLQLSACVMKHVGTFAALAAQEPTRTALAWQRSANDLEFGVGAFTSDTTLGARAAAAQNPTAELPPPASTSSSTTSSSSMGWEGREAAWHSYSLRAALSFDTFFNEYTLNQNGNYLFISGQNAAARDPLAHVMGLAWAGASAQPYVPAVLRTTLAQRRPSGDSAGRPAGSIKWGLAAFGLESSMHFNQSDIELALLFTLGQYVLGTRDTSVLEGAMGEGAWASFLHHRDVISTGAAHGLTRLLYSDHNDGLLGGLGIALTPEIMAQGESVMNGGLAAYTLELYAQALEVWGGVGAVGMAAQARAVGDAQRAAVAALWTSTNTTTTPGGGAGSLTSSSSSLPANSSWYPRAWLGPTKGWKGSPATDGVLWTETQSWALLGRVPWHGSGNSSSSRADALVATLVGAPLSLNPFGALNSYPDATVDGGVGYGGVWACGETALVSALGLRGWGGLALQQWRKASLATHATLYPDMYFGVTSGPDVINSYYAAAHGALPGATRCAWNAPTPAHGAPCNELALPVFNSWPHTLGTYPLPALVGAEFGVEGLRLTPTIPPSEGNFTVFTPLLSLSRKGGQGCLYSGHWAPNATAINAATALGRSSGKVSGRLPVVVVVRLALPPADLELCATLSVNGHPPVNVTVEGGAVVIKAELEAVAGVPMLVWSTQQAV